MIDIVKFRSPKNRIVLIQEILVADLFFFVWGFPNVFDGFPILRYDIWANSPLCFADLNTIEPREVDWQFSQSISSSSCNRISHFLTLDLFQGMMQMDMACAIIMKMQWCQDLKINVLECMTCKYTNTNTQIHKYTNTASGKVADRHGMCYIYERVLIRGSQNPCSWVSDVLIHKYKKSQVSVWKTQNLHCFLCPVFASAPLKPAESFPMILF